MTSRMPDDPAGLALIRRYVVLAADSTSVRSWDPLRCWSDPVGRAGFEPATDGL
jgi:hypothetical protein